MPTTNFYTIDSLIIGEKTTGGTRTDYLSDALGSVIATINHSAQVQNTYRFKPYGAQLSKTGAAPDPQVGWVGTQGYRPTQKKFSEQYAVNRHYAPLMGRWPSADIFKGAAMGTNRYKYVMNAPVLATDPMGMSSDDDLCARWHGSKRWHSCRGQWNQCVIICGGVNNVDHCCTDSWTRPVTGRECACIRPIPVSAPPQTPPPPRNPLIPLPCPCGCGGSVGSTCKCGAPKHIPWDRKRNFPKDSAGCYKVSQGQLPLYRYRDCVLCIRLWCYNRWHNMDPAQERFCVAWGEGGCEANIGYPFTHKGEPLYSPDPLPPYNHLIDDPYDY